jgi:hypothetical protein
MLVVFALPIARAVLAVDRAVAHRSVPWQAMDDAYSAAFTWLIESIGRTRGERLFQQAFQQARKELA